MPLVGLLEGSWGSRMEALRAADGQGTPSCQKKSHRLLKTKTFLGFP